MVGMIYGRIKPEIIMYGKRKTSISAKKLISSVHFDIQISKRNELTLKVGNKIIYDEKDYEWRGEDGSYGWLDWYEGCGWKINKLNDKVSMIIRVGGIDYVHENVNVKFI